MKTFSLSFILFIVASTLNAQSFEDAFSQKKMRKDLAIFKKIRFEANSGLYKYRTTEEIDSIYNWADREIDLSFSHGDFYNIICKLTDFEGSLHNDTDLPTKIEQSFTVEKSGYFPYPITWIDEKWIINFDKGQLPLGSEILEINNERIEDIVKNLYKYYTTDGINETGKRIGLNYNFGKYYRLNYGPTDEFLIKYKEKKSDLIKEFKLKSNSYIGFYKNVQERFSKPYDQNNYHNFEDGEIYNCKYIDNLTAILTINSFNMGDQNDQRHKQYGLFLDSIFKKFKDENIKNLIVDIRYNGGGTDPNDLVTYSYLTNRDFSENKQAWISFNKIPQLKYIESNIPTFLRFLGVRKHNKWFQKEFYIERENGFYQGPLSEDRIIREPNKNAFDGQIYLLISPRVASAGSLFAAMVASNENALTIGEETMGGYYGHNGHTPFTYILPNSKIVTTFSIVNLEQDVPTKENQIYNRGIIPDFYVSQTYNDYLNQKDNQMEFVIKMIDEK